MSDKADKAYDEAKRERENVDKICSYFVDLRAAVAPFENALKTCQALYDKHISALDLIINFNKKNDWNDFTDDDKKLTENTVLLVGLLYSMCKVKLVIPTNKEGELNKINHTDITNKVNTAKETVNELQK